MLEATHDCKSACPEIARFIQFFKNIQEFTWLPDDLMETLTSKHSEQDIGERRDLLNQYHQQIIQLINIEDSTKRYFQGLRVT